MEEPMLYRSITFTNGVISLDQDQITCAPKLIIWPPSICYLVSRPKKVNERMLTMMALIGCFCMRHLVRASIVRYMCRICICLAEMSTIYQLIPSTVVPANSGSDVVLCLQLLSKTLTRTCYLSWEESIDHSCINPILRIGLIHKWSIDYKSLITLWTGHEVTVALGLQDSSYFLACGSCCRLLVAFANGLDPDWDRRQNVGPGLVPSRLTLGPCFCANILEGLILIKVGRRRRLLKMIQQGGS